MRMIHSSKLSSRRGVNIALIMPKASPGAARAMSLLHAVAIARDAAGGPVALLTRNAAPWWGSQNEEDQPMKDPRTFDELARMSANELSAEFRNAALALHPALPADQARAIRLTLERIETIRRSRVAHTPT